LTFIAYGIQPSVSSTYVEDMGFLETQDFRDINQYTFELSQGLVKNPFPEDGKVIRLNDNEAFKMAGYTSSHPRGAYALKERSEGVVTQLLDVVWQVGRTGVVSPVAILKPVVVGEATVARATLHNYKHIQGLGLELGCDVEIIRSGEIIPKVIRRI
jgi:DNA ligase (NAD+)